MASLSGLPCPLWRSLALILAKSTLKDRNEVNEGITLTELDAKARGSAPGLALASALMVVISNRVFKFKFKSEPATLTEGAGNLNLVEIVK